MWPREIRLASSPAGCLGESCMSDLRQVKAFSPNARRILVSTFLAGLGASAFTLLYNLYLLSLGYQADFIGLVSSVTTLSTAAAGPVVVLLGRRVSFGALLRLGFVLQAVGCAGQAVSVAPAGIAAFAVVFGLSQGLYWAPLPPFLAENSAPEARSSLFSMNIAVQLLAGILGYLAGGQTPVLLSSLAGVDGLTSYRVTLVLATAVASLAVVPMSGLHRAPVHAEQASMLQAPTVGKDRATRAHVVALGLSSLSMGVATGLSFPFFNVYFAQQQGASPELIGRVFAASSVFSVGAALAAPATAERLGYVRAIAAARLGAGAAMGALAVSSMMPAAVVAFWLRNMMLQLMAPLIDAFGMMVVPPRRRGLLASTTSTLWHGGYALASALTGLLIVRVGFVPPFLAAAAVIVLNAVAFLAYFRGWQPRVER